MRDAWLDRDLLVLKAAVEVFECDGDPMDVHDIARTAQLDADTVQRALRALSTEPFFGKGQETADGDILWVGKPTGQALRVAGQWPSPETLLDRLVAALDAAGMIHNGHRKGAASSNKSPSDRAPRQHRLQLARSARGREIFSAVGAARLALPDHVTLWGFV
ncbi:hypothetical protein [Mycobacterium marinum]|uniref:hypothetical protein n=1 Tax=Mycobacterium marinum TaxID=1781 RepID=UPI00233FC1C4|nr:hypothetical protein [Mycobacterium marinum]MDC8984092.1 hypothetical protein [Mycobacterium marinum]MDC8995673.1 hypothetical protein [Mycobacterium marinum]MDC9001166.1 hypothetical protein [Mycobacterium marinum]MDC9011358.1 hypothetical protein [Mycobacterium marinum]MDC9016939.1 hypothetical protein [Mycobacterium marinum]